MGYVDIHSHILPGMDDGAKNMAQTLEMLRVAQAEGIDRIIATPHYKMGRFGASTAKIKEVIAAVKAAAAAEGIDIAIYPGNEIYYHSELEERLENGRIATLNDTDTVLVEFSPTDSYTYIRNALDDVMSMGYQPILAHIERYQCMVKTPSHAADLKDMGVLIQMNADSATGETGFLIKRYCHTLLKEQLVDFMGTDAHSPLKRRPAMEKCAGMLYKKYPRGYADQILFQNAEEILL